MEPKDNYYMLNEYDWWCYERFGRLDAEEKKKPPESDDREILDEQANKENDI